MHDEATSGVGTGGADGAATREVRWHRGSDCGVGAGIEKVTRLVPKLAHPFDRDGHGPDSHPIASRSDRVDKPARISDGLCSIVSREGGQIADEILVSDAELVRQSFDRRIVDVNAAERDQRQEKVYSDTATVRVETGDRAEVAGVEAR